MKKLALVVLLLLLAILPACTATAPTVQAEPASISISTVTAKSPSLVNIPAVLQIASAQPTNTPQPLYIFLTEQEILHHLELSRGIHGLYIHEIGSKHSSGVYYNADKQLIIASSVNLAIATATLKVLEDQNIDPFTASPNSNAATFATIIEDMIANHSYIAINTLTNYVNDHGYNMSEVLKNLGFPGFNIYYKYSTPNAYGNLLEAIATNKLGLKYNSYLLSLLEKDKMTFEWSAKNILTGTYLNLVGAVYDKKQTLVDVGTIRYVTSDCGIWTTPTGRQFAFVFIGNYKTEPDFRLSGNILPEISGLLNNAVSPQSP